jgi:hypothetical protein
VDVSVFFPPLCKDEKKVITTGSRTCSYKIYIFSLPSNRTLNLNFLNSSLILMVAHGIYKLLVENNMTQNMSQHI